MNQTANFHVYLYGADGGPLTSRFEEVAERLSDLPRLFFEPDGSLVWVGADWQIDGMLYDRGGILQYADLKGSAQRQPWRRLIERIVYPEHPALPGQSLPAASVLWLPDRRLHDLQTFETLLWGEPTGTDGPN